MSCYHPLRAYRKAGGYDPSTGKWPLTFKKSEGWLETAIDVPCGKCAGCKMDYARSWALRVMHEAKQYDKNCCITLTYDDEHLPKDGELDKREMQNWLKILRNNIGSFRYFGCGEYGKQGDRPHYHIILFGFDWPDKQSITKHLGSVQYESKWLRDIWHRGHISVGNVDFRTAAYIARYCFKKIGGDSKHKQPEYLLMSNRPGIGSAWFDEFQQDLVSAGACIMSSGKYKIPKYYDTKMEKVNPDGLAKLRKSRYAAMYNLPLSEIAPGRVQQKETYKLEGLKKFKRSFEDV